ncbi:jouberin [Thraustotheca clavata]|uniref:Jouberin n=1 Tax=Thraustotheca clavata TaxID=74557 RepID=A0A1V9Z811_9STRA|nr:jouberin [Thraustotheca clavata]
MIDGLVSEALRIVEKIKLLEYMKIGLRPLLPHDGLPMVNEHGVGDGFVLKLTVRGTDALRDDPMIIHPIVLVHIVDITSGAYMLKKDPLRASTYASEPTTFFDGNGIKHCTSEYILPIATRPCLLSANGQGIPKWNEELNFNDAYANFIRPETIVLFELVDFNPRIELLQGMDCYHRVAWGFCRVVSPNSAYNAPTRPQEVMNHRIKLFEYQPSSLLIEQQIKNMQTNRPQPSVFFQFLRHQRVRYPSTLHINFSMVPETSPLQVSHRALHVYEQECKTDKAINSHVLETTQSQFDRGSTRDSFSMDAEHLMEFPSIHCKRYPSELCLVPERMLHRLHSGANGCQVLAFTHRGTHVAAACSDRNEFPIRLYNIDTGIQENALYGHQGVVYALSWSIDDVFLLSASSDGSAKYWQVTPPKVVHSFYHPLPNFVYCVDWLWPRDIALTGSFDGQIRLWSTRTGKCLNALTPIHASRVNTLRMDPKTQRLFSGDATGVVNVWQEKNSTFELIKTIKHVDLMGKSITSMQFHPKRGQLLVQAQPNTLLQFELRSYLLLNKGYTGIKCTTSLIKSSFSPDGRYVVSGSEDGAVFMFSSLNGQRISSSMWGSIFYGNPLLDVVWSPSAHIAAVCSTGPGNPIIILCARRDDVFTKDAVMAQEEKQEKERLLQQQKRLAEQVATLLSLDETSNKATIVPEKA